VNPALAEVTRYLTDAPYRDHALASCQQLIGAETSVVIGHSLGSVVAYEAIRESPVDVPLLVTLGSPLGLNGVNRHLRLPAGWPAGLRRWVNVADRDDLVAARPDLGPTFDRNRPVGAVFQPCEKVDNKFRPHQVGYYLAQLECGRPVGETLDPGRTL
jgi:pimeloyl-ACP methyl ester carboxylesterase